jgi:hypothetical protein
MPPVTGCSGKFSKKKESTFLYRAQILGYDDPFLYLRKTFIHFGYHKITKRVNGFFFMFYSITLLLHICFIVNNFSTDMITTYGPYLLIIAYVSKIIQRYNMSNTYK